VKRFLQVFSLAVLFAFSSIHFVQATNTSYSDVFILVTDGIIGAKEGDIEKTETAIAAIAERWSTVQSEHTAEKQAVDEALAVVQSATTNDARIEALSNFSKALNALKLAENPVDEEAERANFEQKFSPFMKQWEEAYLAGDVAKIQEAYKMLDVKWNQYELPIRNHSIGLYGKIENQLAFMRIALANEVPDIHLANSYYEQLSEYVEQFISGEDIVVENKGYSLQTLVDFVDDALQAIEKEQYKEASEILTQFIIVWPDVEIEVSTRNGSLYNELESQLPLLVSQLMREQVDAAPIIEQLKEYKVEIQLLQQDDSYTYWDSALILLREGLEAILIIMVLVSFLKRSNQEKMTKWIYSGAAAGVLLSVAAAIALSYLFDALTAGSSREMIEGWVGLTAAIMMIGVGMWLHSKSTVQTWNQYLSKQLNHAISKGSIITMASISFLSVFREGAETILFYAGILPKIEMFDFMLGIAIALIILAIVALVLFKLSVKIPIHKFFFVATIMIYVLAFKIIGTSIHTLQLTDVLPTTIISNLPVINVIGFYPTVESMIGQAILLIIWGTMTVLQKKN